MNGHERSKRINMIKRRWELDPRWKGIERDYDAEEVVRLQGSLMIEHTLAQAGATRLWELLVVQDGLESAIARGLAYAPYADLLWFETSRPDLAEARRFAEAIHARYPGKLLAYNCSPSFNWRRHLDDATIARFQRDLGRMGYKFQFITLAGWHSINMTAFELAQAYAAEGMPAYVRLQEHEFAAESSGYTATRHQREVGTAYFDQVATTISQGQSSTTALAGSTEAEQFYH